MRKISICAVLAMLIYIALIFASGHEINRSDITVVISYFGLVTTGCGGLIGWVWHII